MLCKLKKYSVHAFDADIHKDLFVVWIKMEESIKKFESDEDTIQKAEEKIKKSDKLF